MTRGKAIWNANGGFVSVLLTHLLLLLVCPAHYTKQTQLSYRKQIARQLRTQYVDGIHRPKYYTMTLSRLRVTQGHWKRNHWTDHTRLTGALSRRHAAVRDLA